jgi:hypothetical protein
MPLTLANLRELPQHVHEGRELRRADLAERNPALCYALTVGARFLTTRFAGASSIVLGLVIGCGSEAAHPLGGPHGSTGDPADPSSGSVAGDQPGGGPTGLGPRGAMVDAGGAPTTAISGDGGAALGPDSAADPTLDAGTDTSTTLPTGPTWTTLFDTYLAPGTVGNCAASGCHQQFTRPGDAYSYLWGNGYINGTSSALVDPTQSCLSWFGGTMPPSGPASAGNGVADFNAWVAAGALNN